MAIQPINFFNTTLRSPLSVGGTQLQLASGTGALLNQIANQNYDYVIVSDGTSVEIMKYVSSGSIVNDTINVIRAQDGTTQKAFPVGACVTIDWNVAQVREFIQQVAGTSTSLVTRDTVYMAGTDTPDGPPPNPDNTPGVGVNYAVNIDTNQIWYWPTDFNGGSIVGRWVHLTSNNIIMPLAASLGGSPPVIPTPAYGVRWTIIRDSDVANQAILYYWDGDAHDNTTWNVGHWVQVSVLKNTVFLSGTGTGSVPTVAPPAFILYAVNVTTGQIWYWDSINWVHLTSNNIMGAVLHVGVDPLPIPVYGTRWIRINDTASGNILLYVWVAFEDTLANWNLGSWQLISALKNTVVEGVSNINPTAPPPTGIDYQVNTATGRLWYWNGTVWLPVADAYNEILFREFVGLNYAPVKTFDVAPGTTNIFGNMVTGNPPAGADTSWAGRGFGGYVINNPYQSNTALSKKLQLNADQSIHVLGDCIIEIVATVTGSVEVSAGVATKPARIRLGIHHGTTLPVYPVSEWATDARVDTGEGTTAVGLTVTTGPMRVQSGDNFDSFLVVVETPTVPSYSKFILGQYCVCATVLSRRLI